ncbi:hypothetical protein PoB_002475500 [Plakobranchus ocellatus]|uniref:Uncharacterized protein n=1 Tax=Plakobranchus ocellatus TaxID=259542 RepID=A0AAV3ZT21_9GAST|nr:hypothetical protein PoB_002475500 [Plakobranchus ocellatus]
MFVKFGDYRLQTSVRQNGPQTDEALILLWQRCAVPVGAKIPPKNRRHTRILHSIYKHAMKEILLVHMPISAQGQLECALVGHGPLTSTVSLCRTSAVLWTIQGLKIIVNIHGS